MYGVYTCTEADIGDCPKRCGSVCVCVCVYVCNDETYVSAAMDACFFHTYIHTYTHSQSNRNHYRDVGICCCRRLLLPYIHTYTHSQGNCNHYRDVGICCFGRPTGFTSARKMNPAKLKSIAAMRAECLRVPTCADNRFVCMYVCMYV